MSGSATPEAGSFLAMSDEDIMNLTAPPESGVADPSAANPDEGEAGTKEEDEGTSGGEADGQNADDGDSGRSDPEGTNGSPEADAGNADGSGDDDRSAADGKDPADPADEPEAANKVAGDTKATEGKADETNGSEAKNAGGETNSESQKKEANPSPGSEQKAPTPEEYAAFYNKVMAPFQANGKTVQMKTPEEVLQLMQMGANYTRKMQDIAPHRKVLLMLQNNELLDEGKLSYLIDLDKKNPEAIKKLIKESGIDPLDLDLNSEPNYLEGSHRVDDKEVNFRQALEDISSSDAGKETVRIIDKTWDHASKEVLWQSPELMSVFHEQRQNGIYDLITAEVERQRVLGKIQPNVPFLQAYKAVGDELAQAGAFGPTGEQPGTQTPGNPGNPAQEPQVVTTRTAAPKSDVANGDKASAASQTRSTTRKAEAVVNPLAMSDEEFMKLDQFAGRV